MDPYREPDHREEYDDLCECRSDGCDQCRPESDQLLKFMQTVMFSQALR